MIEYPGCSREDIIQGIETAKKRKILHLLHNPSVLSQYILKLYKMRGFNGLIEELIQKLGYLTSRS